MALLETQVTFCQVVLVAGPQWLLVVYRQVVEGDTRTTGMPRRRVRYWVGPGHKVPLSIAVVITANGQIARQTDLHLEPHLLVLVIGYTLDLQLVAQMWSQNAVNFLNLVGSITGRRDSSFIQQPVNVELVSEFKAGLEISQWRVESLHTGRTRSMFPPFLFPELEAGFGFQ